MVFSELRTELQTLSYNSQGQLTQQVSATDVDGDGVNESLVDLALCFTFCELRPVLHR